MTTPLHHQQGTPGYHALSDNDANPFAQVAQVTLETDNEDETPHSGIMIHVVPEASRGESCIPVPIVIFINVSLLQLDGTISRI